MVNVLLCVAFGAAITVLPSATYWRSEETWRFLTHNAAILITPTEFQLPGVLSESPWPSVNVPLWTLKYEMLCYVVLLALFKGVTSAVDGRHARSARLSAFGFVAGGMTAWFVYARAHPLPSTGGLDTLGDFGEVHIVRFFAVFFAGAAYAAGEPWGIGLRWAGAGLIGIAVLLGPTPEVRFVALVMAIGFGAISVGRSRLLYSRTYHHIGDLSYGIYLYAFPIQMLTLSRWLNSDNFWLLTLIDLIVATTCASLSWQFIERPALKLKHGWRQSSSKRAL